jgi:thiamine biosynthesis lipoprotein
MGTAVTQIVHGLNAEAVAEEVSTELSRLEKLWSVFIEQSDIARLATHAGCAPIALHPDTVAILSCARELSALTEGAFDVTAAPLAALWRTAIDERRPVVHGQIAPLLEFVDSRDIELVPPDRGRLRRAGQAVDLGGIAKGWAADRACRLYRQRGIHSAVVNIGGTVKAVGSSPDGLPWRVGIRDPRGQGGALAGRLRIEGCSVVTSGDYQRCFVAQGRRYHHIIDPRTGKPSRSGLAGVTVVCGRSVVGDALATAAMVVGMERARAIIAREPDCSALFIEETGRVTTTPALEPSFDPS